MADADDPRERAVTPLPVPEDAARVVLFGGTFDPPTLAHTEIARGGRGLAAGEGAWLVFVPAARSPFKDDSPAADDHRVAMLRLLADQLGRAAVWTDEIDRAGEDEPSYWVETLRRASVQRPGARLWFIIGADQAAAFDRWRESREILRLASPIVVLRDPIATIDGLRAALEATGAWDDREIAEWVGSVAPIPTIGGSATLAREALAEPEPDRAVLGELLDPAVLDYLVAHGLYRGGGAE